MGVESICKPCKSEKRKPGLAAERAAAASLVMNAQKRCGKCGLIHPVTAFHVRRASVDGLAYKCRECVNRDTEAWRKKHPNAHKEWYAENKEQRSEDFSEYREKNKEDLKAKFAAWAKANKPIVNALVAKRIAAKRKRPVT